MGYVTTFSIYNDECHKIKENPKEFAQAIYDGCCSVRKLTNIYYPLTIIHQQPKHSTELSLFVSYGNTVFEPATWDKEYMIWLKANPKSQLELLKRIKSQLTSLEKICKEEIKNNKENGKK